MEALRIMKRTVFLFAVFLTCAFSAVAQGLAVGSTTENFKLSDINGKNQSFSDLKGKNGTVVVFLSAQCPVVKGYNERISQAAADFGAKGIRFIGINANASESLELVRSHAIEHYKFPVLIDKDNVIADKYGANVTPEIFFFDAGGKLIYHGAIDNDRSGRNPTEHYLRAAVDASLSGNEIARTSVNAFGCSIKRKSGQ